MSAQTDSFAGFIDVVASSLDEPARADELAARLHVSRSQLDRVVSAAAGEAPGRLRRRILLERAAFRLLEGKLGVLDVALEAGYASHEAFTRAFRREYGVAPSEWRTSPGAMHLPARTACTFIPPAASGCPREER
jgi:AraC-like DNA-binding protein